MVLSPGNLLYVTTGANKLFEIDPLTLTVTPLGQISVPGLAGPLQFTPDGSAAFFVNQTACGTCSPSLQADRLRLMPSRRCRYRRITAPPPTVDQMLVAGNNRVFALSTSTNISVRRNLRPFAMSPTDHRSIANRHRSRRGRVERKPFLAIPLSVIRQSQLRPREPWHQRRRSADYAGSNQWTDLVVRVDPGTIRRSESVVD